MVDITIIGIDPGGTTGICAWSPVKDTYVFDQLETKDGEGYRVLVNWIDRTQHSFGFIPPFVLVVERFNFRMNERDRTKIDYTAAEVIGALRFAFETEPTRATTLHFQMAAEGKAFFDDDKLRRLGLWKGSQMRHAMDALRHVLHYRTFTLGDKSVLEKFKPKEEVQ